MEGFLSWRPMSYCAHFAGIAPQAPRPGKRRPIEELARQMSMILLATCDGIRNELPPQKLGVMAEMTARWLRPLVARAGAVISGEVENTAATYDAAPQDTIDALFDRKINEAFQA